MEDTGIPPLLDALELQKWMQKCRVTSREIAGSNPASHITRDGSGARGFHALVKCAGSSVGRAFVLHALDLTIIVMHSIKLLQRC